MKDCSFYNDGICSLLSHLRQRRHFVVLEYCQSRCGPNQPNKQKQMLDRRGIFTPCPPAGPSDLEKWTKKVKINYSPSVQDAINKTKKYRRQKEKEQADIDAAMAVMPSKYQMIKNLGRHTLNVVSHYKKTGRVFVNEYQQAERLEVCEACEHYKVDNSGHPRCKQASCGCHLSGELGKTRFEALPCPIGKHKTIDSNYNKD